MLIVIEGLDGSGKAVQTRRLAQNLAKSGYSVKELSFPRYANEASVFVQRYLTGNYSSNAEGLDPKISSLFFALDRFDAFYGGDKLIDFVNEPGNVLLCDRYVTSNTLHQTAKIDGLGAKKFFIDWLHEIEHELLQIPKPDLVVFLDVPPTTSVSLVEKRGNAKDLHENVDFLTKSYNNAKMLLDYLKWHAVDCIKDGHLRTIEDISDEVFEVIKSKLVNGGYELR